MLVFASALVATNSTAFAAPAAPTSSVATPFVGQVTTLTGNIGTPVIRSVELQKYSSSTWSKYASGKTLADGSYTFTASTTATSRRFRVYAKAENGLPALTSDVVTIKTQRDLISLVVSRVGNTATGSAVGVASPVLHGRPFALQYKSGDVWKQVGSKVAEDADGKVQTTFTLNGSKSYRFRGAAVEGSSGATSPTVAFSPGPKTLGAHVIYVTTDSGKTPTTKGVDYTGTAVIDTGEPLDLETIAVRGNSSADKPKKPYKLKFEEKQEPFGLKKDKTWILLANYGDHTLVRSKAAWDLGGQLLGLKWTPKSVFTELFLNGKYMGSYQLVQSIKIDSNRVSVNKTTGQVIEFDPHWAEDGIPGFVGPSGQNFAWKDPDEFKTLDPEDGGGPDPEGLTSAKITAMKAKIRNFEHVLYARGWSTAVSNPPAVEADWTTYLDISSAVDYYLAREFTKDNDADFYRSNFFYTNNVDPASPDKFFMGPIWDFDRSAGAKPPGDTTVSSPTGWWIRGNGSPNHDTNKIHWYTRIAKDPRFLAALDARWAEKRLIFKAVADTQVDAAVAQVGTNVAANDRALWGKSGSRYAPKSSSYSGEITWVKKWYNDRFEWMDSQLTP